MDLIKALGIAASGLKAQSGRVKVITENLVQADTTAARPGVDPYRRKITSFWKKFDRDVGADTVELGRVQTDRSPFRVKFDPGNPVADAKGNVLLPNVDPLVESMDLRQAQRSYEANLNIITATRKMLARTIDILRA